MDHIIEREEEGIRIVKLASGKSNALHPDMVDELLAAVRRVSVDPAAQGLVLASDRPRFFSPGFDVNQVFRLDRCAMTDFFGCFIDLYEALLAVPKPVVAAVSGHAVAGGAVLALTADERVLCEGDYRFALIEVDLGVELPPKVMRMMIAAGGFAAAADMLLAGAAVGPERALAIGLAHDLAPPADVLLRAVNRCRALAQKPRVAYAAIKRHLQEEARLWETKSDRETLHLFLDQWFSPESVQARRLLVESMRR
jgi:enoyl-CoA hydratase/carnithine racemase